MTIIEGKWTGRDPHTVPFVSGTTGRTTISGTARFQIDKEMQISAGLSIQIEPTKHGKDCSNSEENETSAKVTTKLENVPLIPGNSYAIVFIARGFGNENPNTGEHTYKIDCD